MNSVFFCMRIWALETFQKSLKGLNPRDVFKLPNTQIEIKLSDIQYWIIIYNISWPLTGRHASEQHAHDACMPPAGSIFFLFIRPSVVHLPACLSVCPRSVHQHYRQTIRQTDRQTDKHRLTTVQYFKPKTTTSCDLRQTSHQQSTTVPSTHQRHRFQCQPACHICLPHHLLLIIHLHQSKEFYGKVLHPTVVYRMDVQTTLKLNDRRCWLKYSTRVPYCITGWWWRRERRERERIGLYGTLLYW